MEMKTTFCSPLTKRRHVMILLQPIKVMDWILNAPIPLVEKSLYLEVQFFGHNLIHQLQFDSLNMHDCN